MIGSALEYTEPLEWIDGLPLLDARPSDAGPLTAARCPPDRPCAGARWYVDGTVMRRQDSVTVVAAPERCGRGFGGGPHQRDPHRAAGRPGRARRGQPAAPASCSRRGNGSAICLHWPTATPRRWRAGCRESASTAASISRRALEFERRAVAADSALAVAALRGAQAASWLNDMPEAGALATAALRHVSLLPPRMADFARGLDAYLDGQADSAVHWLTSRFERARSGPRPTWRWARSTTTCCRRWTGRPTRWPRRVPPGRRGHRVLAAPLPPGRDRHPPRQPGRGRAGGAGVHAAGPGRQGSRAELEAMLACARGGRNAVSGPGSPP